MMNPLTWLRVGLLLTLALAFRPAAAAAQLIEYYHLDALGSVRAVTNQAGQVVERHDYLPFGEECTTPPCAVTPPGTNTFKFTGKERDPESGLDYFGARYYGARIARFTTVDPVLDQRAALVDPQQWNRYAYVRNNPLRYVDPDGRAAKAAREVAQKALFEAARRRAVRQAWAQEREILVKHGPSQMSIRLTKAEQKELLDRGAVSGWQGHHINNVASNDLAMAGDPSNIKFVKGTKAHLDEHSGHFRNATSGPLMDRFRDFMVSLIPGMFVLEAGEVAVEAAGAGADQLQEKVMETNVGRGIREREEAQKAASGQQ